MSELTAKTYAGSCHCGTVRFEVDLDLAAGTGKCNCSICSKTRNWSASVKPEAFRLLSDDSVVTDYQFNTKAVHWPFCRICGVRSYSYGDIPEVGGAFYSVNLNALDDLPVEALAEAKVGFSNGRDDDWMHEPSEIEKRVL